MRRRWRNHTGNQSCRPARIVAPSSLRELIELVRAAEAEGTTVRAVGAGHSWSDVALTDGFLLEPGNLVGCWRPESEPLRLEPRDGPTDPDAFADETLTLVQDDAKFHAAACGMGTLGLIHSLLLEVREKFWLNEVRTLSTWEEQRDVLSAEGALANNDHYELFLNPYPQSGGSHRALVTRRGECPEPLGLPQDKLERHPLTELQASLPITGVVLRFLARHLPKLMTRRFDSVLADMRDDGYANVSYKVFNIGEANKLPAYSMELGVAVDGRHLEAVDRILELAPAWAKEGLYHSSPISLRFVAPSRAYASMMHEQPTMMIELIMVDGTRRGYELLGRYETQLADLDIRTHWGQYNPSLSPGRLAELYPEWGTWREAADEFNRSGVFNSQFTTRIGLTREGG